MMQTIQYLLGIKNYIAIIILLFFFSALAGYIFSAQNPQLAQELFDESVEAFGFVFDLNSAQVFLFIFFNNSLKVLAVMLAGVVFGIAPVLFIFLNGYVLGVFFYAAPVGTGEFLTAIIPHGIIEIPAAIVGSAIGLALGARFFRKIFKKQEYNMKNEIKESMVFYFYVVLPFLLIAALIETFITPLFLV